MSRARSVLPAAMLAAVLAVAPAVLGIAGPLPDASAAPAADSDHPLGVVITEMQPVSIGPTGTVTVAGTVTNHGSEPLDDLSVTFGVGPHIDSRDGLSRDLAQAPVLALALRPASLAAPQSLGPGGSGSFRLTFDVEGSGLASQRPTVYPFQVRFDSGRRTSLGQADTFLPYFPDVPQNPLRIVWVLPLTGAPALDAQRRVADPDVPATFGPQGRLRTLLDLALPPTQRTPRSSAPASAPVTLAVDPALIETIGVLSRAGWTRPGDDTKSDRAASVEANSWLADLKARTRGSGVIALPYADPDAVALVRAGLSADLASAIALGRASLTDALPASTVQTVAWPVDGAVDQDTLDAYTGAGDTSVLVDSAQIPTNADANVFTQSAPTLLDTKGPRIRALAVDSELTGLLAGGGRDAPSVRMAAQRVLAVLAVAEGERPNGFEARDVLLALPRASNPNVTWLRTVLGDTAAATWLHPVTLDQTENDPLGNRAALAPYPAGARARELTPSSLIGPQNSVTELRTRLADIRAMLPDDQLTRPLADAVSRAESLAFRAPTPGGSQRALLDGVSAQATALLGGVTLAVTGQVTLASRNGNVPITVRNTLSKPVSVDIALSTSDRTKLTSAGARRFVIEPGQKRRVLLPAKTQRAGTFRVELSVATPDGRVIARAPLTVHSTAYGTITLVITLVALGVLVVALMIRFGRRLRNWRSGRSDPRGEIITTP